jgi:hypothetical protein
MTIRSRSPDGSVRWAAAEGVPEPSSRLFLLLHQRSVDEIAA